MFYLSPAELREQDLVSNLNSHGDVGSSLVSGAGPNGHDCGVQGLGLSLLRDQDASLGFGFSGNTLK